MLGLATVISESSRIIESTQPSLLNIVNTNSFEFLLVSMYIYIAPSYFAVIKNETLKGLDFCFAYLHDI